MGLLFRSSKGHDGAPLAPAGRAWESDQASWPPAQPASRTAASHGPADPSAAGSALRVDPIACGGVGICALLAPDLVRLDPWGYPMVDSVVRHGREQRSAERAVAACPRRALSLTWPGQRGSGSA